MLGAELGIGLGDFGQVVVEDALLAVQGAHLQAAADADDDVAQFARHLGEAVESNPLALTDADLARVTEDLIDVLIDRAVIQFTDLPLAAQNKLLQRRQTRANLSRRLDLLGSDELL